jgi:glycosyltransferase involved in cell wall biosynthesis
MKRIFACIKVQNDADIIESFCRYYCSFCDGILVIDDSSSDNTLDILKSLAEERLPVFITDNSNIDGVRLNQKKQIKLAIDNYQADLVLPVDVDEFIVNINGGNPRPVLESLDETKEYHIIRRNYICPQEINDNKIFYPSIPKKYTELITPKTIMHRFLLNEKKAKPAVGYHSFAYASDPPDIVDLKILCYNHYPIRNVYQFMIKIIFGWVNVLTTSNPNFAPWHWKEFYEEIKKNGKISQDMLERFSVYNSTFIPKDNNYQLFDGIFDTSFCLDKLNLRYTNYTHSREYFLSLLTTQLEKNMARIYRQKVNKLQEKNIQLHQQLDALHNSRSWKITKPLRFVSGLIKGTYKTKTNK